MAGKIHIYSSRAARFEPLRDVLFVLARKLRKDFSCHGLMTVLIP